MDIEGVDREMRIEIREDYRKLLTERGITEEEVRAQSENEEDQIPMPFGNYKMGIYNSPIEGKGVFATSNIDEGETIAPARIGNKRTPVGRYTNHSIYPNAKMVRTGDDVMIVAISPITGCKGGQNGEEITTNYRDNMGIEGVDRSNRRNIEGVDRSNRRNIEDIEKDLLKFAQSDCPVTHTFGPGLYVREVRIPKGTLAIGHHQVFEQMNIFLQGKILMANDNGSNVILSAPMVFTGQPGRKMGYVLEDVVWLNVYPTDETDIEKLESTYLIKDESWREDNLKRIESRNDYRNLLIEMGVNEGGTKNQPENEEDQVPLPSGSYKMGIYNSPIGGKGVFATANIAEGEIIAPAVLGSKRTPVGVYISHSLYPNAKMSKDGDDLLLVAISPISGCKGGRLGGEITTNYRDTIELED